MTRFVRRPRCVRRVVPFAAGLLLMSMNLVSPASAADPEADPLRVTVDRLGPSAIPSRGRITVAGTITNDSDSTWSALQVYPLTSSTPFRTDAEVAEAAASDPRTYIGNRLTDYLVNLPGELGPGASTRFRLRVPRDALELSGEQGVYWFGVHVLGDEDGVRLEGADGRARIFMPLIRPRSPRTTSLALMLPFRARIARDATGRIVTPVVWRRALSPEGRFGRLLELTRSAGAFPVTWVVDPAVLDLAKSLATDDPGFDVALAGPGTSPSASPSGDGEKQPDLSDEARDVQAWLDAFTDEAKRHDVLAVPYGDVDLAAAYRTSYESVAEDAAQLSEETLSSYKISSTPVADPADGVLPWEAVGAVGSRTPVVLSEGAVKAQGPRVDVLGGARITLTDDGVTSGGGTVVSPYDALPLRQRILAEAAVHALSRNRGEPLVVQLPQHWNPGASWRRARFFQGLSVPWLAPAGAGALARSGTASSSITPESDDLVYPAAAPEIPAINFVTTLNLIRAGHTLDVLLPGDDPVERTVTGYALLGASEQMREVSERAEGRTDELQRAVTELLSKVTVTGPSFVTMSSEDGPFQVTLNNGLDRPVRVGIEARAVGTDKITVPATDPLTIPAGQRRSVRLHANSDQIGVWPVQLQPVNAEGTPVGEPTELKVRSSHVGQYIWAVLGGGTLVLVILIVVRVRRKVKARQSTHGPVLKQEAPE